MLAIMFLPQTIKQSVLCCVGLCNKQENLYQEKTVKHHSVKSLGIQSKQHYYWITSRIDNIIYTGSHLIDWALIQYKGAILPV